MFEEMVVSSPKAKKTNKPWTVVVSMILQVTFLDRADPDSVDLHGSAAEDEDGDVAHRSATAATASSAARRGAGRTRQAAGRT